MKARRIGALLLVIAMLAIGVGHAEVLPQGGGSGAIFTTTPDGGIVNENVHYEAKNYVYLDGGPKQNAPPQAAGLDEGFYVFQVTDPPGKLLLSVDPARCRIVHVNEYGVIDELMAPTDNSVTDPDGLTVVDYTTATTDNWADAETKGKFDYSLEPCHAAEPPDPYDPAGPDDAGVDLVSVPDFIGFGRHDTNTDNDHGLDFGAIVVQLMPYGTTPNPGGVYKAWLTPIQAYTDIKGADLNDIPADIKGKVKPHDCPDFCAGRDPGFTQSGRYWKTDNFKVEEFYPPEIRVRKFHDVNGNSLWDAGEPEIGVDECVQSEGPNEGDILATCGAPPQGGWPYEWTWPLDGGDDTATFYTPWTHVAGVLGTYTAEEWFLNQWVQTAAYLDGDPSTGEGFVYDNGNPAKAVSVSVLGMPLETHEIVFGNTRPGKIYGKKVIDYNADGFIDAEDICPSDSNDVNYAGCAGVTVHLDGVDNMGLTVSLSTQTCGGPTPPAYCAGQDPGYFEFDDLWPGTYDITIDDPSGFFCSYPAPCQYTGIVINSGDVINLDLQFAGDASFADWQPGSKSGMKFEDIDGQGDKDDTDPGLSGWKIHLWGLAGTGATIDVFFSTDANGNYTFDGIPPGNYNVCEVIFMAGVVDFTDWTQTYPNETHKPDGAVLLDCSGFQTGLITHGPDGYLINLTSGENETGNDFGNYENGKITACKYKDRDGDGDKDEPFVGWWVEQTINGSVVDRQQTTDGTEEGQEIGCYTWYDLGPLPEGSYYDAHEEQRDGWVPTSPTEVIFPAPPESGFDYRAEFTNTPTQGCTPGFWQGGPEKPDAKAGGSLLWDGIDSVPPDFITPLPPPHVDAQWLASGGDAGGNPYIHGTLFKDVFGVGSYCTASIGDSDMWTFISTGGGSDICQKTARDVVAAYLNASWGMAYAYTVGEIDAMWDAASADGYDALMALHTDLDKANNATDPFTGVHNCPISASGW